MYKLCAGAHVHRNYNYIRSNVYTTVKQYKALERYEAHTVINVHINANVRVLLSLSAVTIMCNTYIIKGPQNSYVFIDR